MYFKIILFFSSLMFSADLLWTQESEQERVILDAMVVSSDSLIPIPNTHIISKFNRVGTIADNNGRFKMYINPHDSLLITSVGFSPRILYITDSIRQMEDIIQITLDKDTIMINEVVIRAFFDYEVFKQMVINMEPIDLSQFYPEWEGTELMYQDIKPVSIKGPIQALYDQFNHAARLQRKLIRNREQYNELMRKMGRIRDTIPAIPEHMQELPH